MLKSVLLLAFFAATIAAVGFVAAAAGKRNTNMLARQLSFNANNCPNLPALQYRSTHHHTAQPFDSSQAAQLDVLKTSPQTVSTTTVNNTISVMPANNLRKPAVFVIGRKNQTVSTPKRRHLRGGNSHFQPPTFNSRALCPALPAQRITPHFKQWLDANGYKQYEFETNGCGRGNSFGGQQNDADKPSGGSKRPVVFIHGNSDSAIGSGHSFGSLRLCGWTPNINYFMQNGGYKMADLYALTWGPSDPLKGNQQTHSKMYVERVNKFLQAVLTYTNAPKIDVITHSQGVTVGRGAIAGVNGAGPNLSGRVANFVGIAGGNHGLSVCYTPHMPGICNSVDGYDRNSQFLLAINTPNNIKVADNIYSIWSPADTTMRCESVSPNTCLVPGQKCDAKVNGIDHITIRDQSSPKLMQLLTSGQC